MLIDGYRFARSFLRALAGALLYKGEVMGVSRDDLYVGGRVFMKTRLPIGAGGAAVAMKLKPGVVRKIEGTAALIELVEEKNRRVLVPFNGLEPDEGFLDERDRKEEQKRKRIESESLRLVAPPAPLTYTLSDKFKNLAKGFEEEPPARPVSDEEREAALKQLAALREQNENTKPSEPPSESPPPTAPAVEVPDAPTTSPQQDDMPRKNMTREEREAFEFTGLKPLSEYDDTYKPLVEKIVKGELEVTDVATPVATIPAPGGHPSKPTPIYNPTPWPKEAPSIIPPAEPRPRPKAPEPPPEPTPPVSEAPKPQSPMQRLLARVQADLEKLMGEEYELERQEQWLGPHAERLRKELADIEQRLEAAKKGLVANREKQSVLGRQEKTLMAAAGAQSAPPPPPPSEKQTVLAEIRKELRSGKRTYERTSTPPPPRPAAANQRGPMRESVPVAPIIALARALMEKTGCSQTSIAMRLGMSPPQLSRTLGGYVSHLGQRVIEQMVAAGVPLAYIEGTGSSLDEAVAALMGRR